MNATRDTPQSTTEGGDQHALPATATAASSHLVLSVCGSDLDPTIPAHFFDGVHPAAEGYSRLLACLRQEVAGELERQRAQQEQELEQELELELELQRQQAQHEQELELERQQAEQEGGAEGAT